jgi:hypothetical protein
VLRAIRWTLVAVGGVMLVQGGVSIFIRPAHELLYGLDPPRVVCHPRGCLAVYSLELGNTGHAAQSEVVVRLRTAALQRAALPPRFYTFGAVERPVRQVEAGGTRLYALGALRPEDRVTLRFTLRLPEGTQTASWDDVLAGVDAAEGPVKRGSPGWVILVRIYYDLVRWL